MRMPLAAGNWKMNLSPAEAADLAHALKDAAPGFSDVEILLCPPAIYIAFVQHILKDTDIRIGGQNLHWETGGAFTGEVSGPMLRDSGCNYCIIGHSERRHVFGETDEEVNRKVKAALAHELVPILCVGEKLEQREANQTAPVIEKQMLAGLAELTPAHADALVIAYEPVWAIGTGRTATPEQANEVHTQIRGLLRQQFGEEQASQVRILYGGSVKPGNIDTLMAEKEIDGALVGGASLIADDFLAIIQGCQGRTSS